MTQLKVGVQLHLSVLRAVNLPELVELGRMAADGGVTQLWLTDNLNNRNTFAVLGTLAAKIPIDLGTAILVQYFHNPVEVAGAAATVSEMMDGRELILGISRGNESTSNLIATPKPVSMLRETAQSVKRLLAGDNVTFDQYPTLASYFNLVTTTPFRLSFPPPRSVHLYCGGNAPASLAVGGEFMDGLIFGGTFQAVGLTGRLPSLLQIFDTAADKAGKPGPPRRVAEVKLSVSRDGSSARRFAANSAGTRLLSLRHRGFTDEEIERTGVPPADLNRFEDARKGGVVRPELADFVTDQMIDAVYVAGDPMHCKERMIEISRLATENAFEQLMFSEFGPDPREGLRLLCDEIMPAL